MPTVFSTGSTGTSGTGGMTKPCSKGFSNGVAPDVGGLAGTLGGLMGASGAVTSGNFGIGFGPLSEIGGIFAFGSGAVSVAAGVVGGCDW